MSRITVTLKTLSGNVFPLSVRPEHGLDGIARTLSERDPVAFPFSSLRILRQETEEKEAERPLYEGESLYVFVHSEYYILNLTTSEYVVCLDREDMSHETVMKRFMKPLSQQEALLSQEVGTSHWLPTDHVVFVPEHVMSFVAAHYQRLK